MAEVTRTRRIGAAPEQVWSALADFGAISAWAPNVDHSSLLCAGGPGEHVGLVRRIQTGRRTVLERVVRWEHGTVLAYEIEGLPKPVRSARNEWRLAPDGEAGCHASLTTRVACGRGPPQRLLAAIVTRRLAALSDVMLVGLDDFLERTDA